MRRLQVLVLLEHLQWGKADYIFYQRQAKDRFYIRLEGFTITQNLPVNSESEVRLEVQYRNKHEQILSIYDFELTPLQIVNHLGKQQIEFFTDWNPNLYVYPYNQDPIDILKRWDDGESVNWRSLTVKRKKAYVKACLIYSDLPSKPIPSGNYILDGAQLRNEPDLYCLLGELFIGERRYLGQGPDSFYDCFCYSGDGPHEPFVKPNTTVTILNSTRLEKSLNKHLRSEKSYFSILIEDLKQVGFIVELKD